LFNKLLGVNDALVDNTPGLTRDRKEGEFKMFGVKIRVIDTAGINDFEENKIYDDIINKTIEQTRKALIYSDLAFFLIDSRIGITFTDIKLANWINEVKYLQENKDVLKIEASDKTNSNNDYNGLKEMINSKINKKEQENFYGGLKNLKQKDEINIPQIKLIANKAENNFVPDDVFSDFVKLKLGEPLLISAEHGDNMVIERIYFLN